MIVVFDYDFFWEMVDGVEGVVIYYKLGDLVDFVRSIFDVILFDLDIC